MTKMRTNVFMNEEALDELEKEYMFIDMHIHSEHSHDSNSKIKTILQIAKKDRMGVAITDHNKIGGVIEACKQKKIPVIPGIEILAKESKEILIYFYSKKDLADFFNKRIKSKIVYAKNRLQESFFMVKTDLAMEDIVDFSRAYASIRSIPHPYAFEPRYSHHFFNKRKALLKKIEAIECVNSFLPREMNSMAKKWVILQDKAMTAGSDAHIAKHIGSALTGCYATTTEEFLDELRRKRSIIIEHERKMMSNIKDILKESKTRNEKYRNGTFKQA